MYQLPYFTEKDRGLVVQFLRDHPFALLAGCAGARVEATQVPLLVEEKEGKVFLRGHFMRQTGHHKAFQENSEALCVFTGPHTYVSARWYQHPQTASTWNYMTVHARGTIRFLEEEGLMEVLEQTTALFENDPHSPALFEKLPSEYVRKLAAAIVAFEIEVHSLENVFKLSQNRDRASYETIIRELDQQGGDAKKIADEMEKRKEKLFS